jgi:hypothetical protein
MASDIGTTSPKAPAETWGTEFATAFVKAQAEMQDVTKGRTANTGTYSYSYADLADVLSDSRPILTKHGLALSQAVVTNGRDVEVWTTILHTSGQYRTDGPLAFNGGSNPQQAGSAITYARRYSALASLGLASEDDDGAKAANEPTASKRGRPAPQEPELLTKRPGDLMAERVAEAIKNPDVLKALKEADKDRKGFSGKALDDDAWREQVADILNQQVAA